MTTLALYSNKGGVGKTAAAVNLAYLAAQSGYATLVCDLDPQGSTTFYFRAQPRLKRKARGLVGGARQLDESIKATDYDNLDLLPADFSHRNLDITFDKQKRPTERLEMALKPLRKDYDLIILDSPPSFTILAENIFNAADWLLIPLVPTTLCQHSFEQLLGFFGEQGRALDQVTAFFSLVDKRKKLHNQTMTSMQEQVGGRLLQTPISQLSQIEQMGVYRQPVPVFAPKSAAAMAYRDLWAEMRMRFSLPAPRRSAA